MSSCAERPVGASFQQEYSWDGTPPLIPKGDLQRKVDSSPVLYPRARDAHGSGCQDLLYRAASNLGHLARAACLAGTRRTSQCLRNSQLLRRLLDPTRLGSVCLDADRLRDDCKLITPRHLTSMRYSRCKFVQGIVLRMLEGRESLADITHIIIDEVHERSIDSDFLLIILREILEVRKDLK